MPASPVLVRRATIEDAFEIAEIQIAGWRATYRGLMPDNVLESLDIMTSAANWSNQIRAKKLSVELAELSERVLGFAAFGAGRDADASSPTMELFALYVAPESQRLGGGSALLNSVVEHCRKSDVTRLTLWVASANQRALRFYAKHGLLPDGAEKIDSALTGSPIPELRCARSLP